MMPLLWSFKPRKTVTTIPNTKQRIFQTTFPHFDHRLQNNIEIEQIHISCNERGKVDIMEENKERKKKRPTTQDIRYASFVRLFSLHVGQIVLDFIFVKLEWRNENRFIGACNLCISALISWLTNIHGETIWIQMALLFIFRRFYFALVQNGILNKFQLWMLFQWLNAC